MVGQAVQSDPQSDGVAERVGAGRVPGVRARLHRLDDDGERVLAQGDGLGVTDSAGLDGVGGVPGPAEHHPVALRPQSGEVQVGRADRPQP